MRMVYTELALTENKAVSRGTSHAKTTVLVKLHSLIQSHIQLERSGPARKQTTALKLAL